MSKKLVIVESPSKSKTIEKYLGSDYVVTSSKGHVRDLATSGKEGLGVDIENQFEPKYVINKDKKDVVKELKKCVKEADYVYLATDPDREGEAISWHLATALKLDEKKMRRITFNEITKDAVKKSIKNSRDIDMNLVDAQQARRVLDRLVGYSISPILWAKVRKGLSAGRVQSVATRILCDREQEIMDFVSEEYWTVSAMLRHKGLRKPIEAKFYGFHGKKTELHNESEADEAIARASKGDFVVTERKVAEKVRSAPAPFTTSSLQQEASRKLGFTAKLTMLVAQQLYEGVEIKGHGTLGLVTYIRTDSVRISKEASMAAREFILDNFGPDYAGNNVFSNKKKDIQDAHEAIRPSNVRLDPQQIKESLTKDQYSLYKLIWTRFLASQMAPALFDSMQVNISNGDYGLRANGSKLLFDGYQKIYSSNMEEDRDKILPDLSEGEALKANDIKSDQKFTEPPARFTEASLVKDLEEKNIGRPSTYAPIIATLLERKYITRQKKTLSPTDLGFLVTGMMEEYFKEIADTGFTAGMEDKLDEVEVKDLNWKEVVRDFYANLKEELAVADEAIEKVQIEDQPTDEVCPLCGRPMVIKSGRFGEFMACSGYPECKNTKAIVQKVGVTCPDCGGDIVAKRGRSGKLFYGCSNYPTCKRAYWYKPVDRKCPECGSLLLERNSKNAKFVCSNDKCGYKEQ